MEKGDRIYIVHASGTLEDGAKAFTNYPDARKYAKEWADVTAGDAIAELADKSKVRTYIVQEEKVGEGKEPATKIPFEINVMADTCNGDYCEIKIIKETLN